MNKTKRQDGELMKLLNVTEISRIICDTNMGTLKLRIRKGENEYHFLLDSVPLPKELNKEVYELLYAPEIPKPKVVYDKNPSLADKQFQKWSGEAFDDDVPYFESMAISEVVIEKPKTKKTKKK